MKRRKKTPSVIDAGTLAQRKRTRHPMPPPSFVMKDKKKYNRKDKGKPLPDEL